MKPETGSSERLSPEVQAAQEKLLNLRAARGIVPKLESEPATPVASALQVINWSLRNAQNALQHKRLQSSVATQTNSDVRATPACFVGGEGEGTAPLSTINPSSIASRPVIAHPTMLLAILKQNLEAPGRVYFLLRSIDVQGRGWLTIDNIRRLLTAKDSAWRICGWRRLRQIFKQGEGVFWQRDDQDRLWLKGAHKIAYTLDCDRLTGSPIRLPISSLLGGIQAVRGAFYAAFHSGRASSPISRHTVQELSGIPERTQRSYDQAAHVKRQTNLAIGERYSKEKLEERAWQRGRAVFHFVDTRGLHGRPQAEYLAWRLPNSYTGPYERRSRANRKRVNRKLADLVKKGIPGTSEQRVERLFWPNGAQAAKGFNRDPHHDAYWPIQASPPKQRFWRVMCGFIEK